MKANVGMLYVVAAPVDTYTPYSGITYDDGFVVGEGREANISWQTASGQFVGDDIILDDYEEIIGNTITLETAGIANTVRAAMLGEVKGSGDEYKITGAPKPWLGLGFIRKMRDDSSGEVVTSYEAVWLYRLKFSQPDENTRTKDPQGIDWRVPVLNGRGTGIFTTSGQEHPDFEEHKDFATLASAKSYLNTLVGIS